MRDFGNFSGITGLRQKNWHEPPPFRRLAYVAFFATVLLFAHVSMAIEDAESLIERSAERLASLKTIECNLRMDVWVDGIEFSARGRYEEQIVKHVAPNDFLRSMYRLDVNFLSDAPLAPGTDPNRMTIVCHISSEDRAKSQVWQYRSIEGKKDLSIIRLSKLEEAIGKKKNDRQPLFVSGVRDLGGIYASVKQIEQYYEFKESPQSVTLDGQGGMAVWKLNGTLRKEHYEKLLEKFGGLGKKKRLPSGFPSDIELWIGQDDLFPYKILYLSRPTEGSKKKIPVLQTSWFDIILNGEEIDPGNFALFNENGEYPEGVFHLRDDTQKFINSLGL